MPTTISAPPVRTVAIPTAGPAPTAPATPATDAPTDSYVPSGSHEDNWNYSNLARGNNANSKTYYVCYSGMGDSISWAGQSIRSELKKQGVPEDQCLVMSDTCNKFGSSGANPQGVVADLAQNLDEYRRSTSPDNADTFKSKDEVELSLKAKKFDPSHGDRVVLIGHSLGGQRAVSVAELLERDGCPADQVVTLGTPMWHNGCQQTPVTNVASAHDPVVMGAGNLPGVSATQGKARGLMVDSNHQGYWKDDAVFGQVAQEALRDPRGQVYGSQFNGTAALDGQLVHEGEAKLQAGASSLTSTVEQKLLNGAVVTLDACDRGVTAVGQGLVNTGNSMVEAGQATYNWVSDLF